MIKQRVNAVQKHAPGVQVSAQEVRRRASLDRISWDNMRLLLILSEAGSFRSAAVVAGISLNTIRSKIDRLERQIGGVLIRRSVEGVTLTQEGYELVSIAKQMRALGKTAERVQASAQGRREASVRITITEGLGTFWLVPHLVDFRAKSPDIHIDLQCDMSPPDVMFRDVDISIQLERPTNPDLIVQKIGTLHLMPFAAESYLDLHGTPTSVADARDHKLVWQVADQVASEILPMFVAGDVISGGLIAVTTNTSSAQFWAVTKGAGIGFLPTYIRVVSRGTRPLDIGLHLRRSVYLVHHPDSVRFPEVRKALDWVKGAFDKTKYPWFADEFVHPDEFERRFNDSVVVNLFEGFR
jgi:DNA-binding transcriptional LysR family regulator